MLGLCVCLPAAVAGEGGMSQEEKAKMVLDDLADRLPEQYDMEDIRGRVDEVTPYVMVAIQVRQGGSVHVCWTCIRKVVFGML